MHEIYMKKAIKKAMRAYENNEVPVGSVIVEKNIIISTGYNNIEKKHSCLEHSEIIAIRKAQLKKNNWRLNECTIYTTLEPCLMCAGAIINSRIKRVVCATTSNHISQIEREWIQEMYKKNNVEIIHGVLKEESQKLLSNFFEEKRKNKKNVENVI